MGLVSLSKWLTLVFFFMWPDLSGHACSQLCITSSRMLEKLNTEIWFFFSCFGGGKICVALLFINLRTKIYFLISFVSHNYCFSLEILSIDLFSSFIWEFVHIHMCVGVNTRMSAKFVLRSRQNVLTLTKLIIEFIMELQ